MRSSRRTRRTDASARTGGPGRAGSRRPILTTIWAPDDRRWNELCEVSDRRTRRWLPFVVDVALRSRQHDAVLLQGALGWNDRYQDLMIGLLTRLVGSRRTRIVLAECTWSPGSTSISGESRVVSAISSRVHRVAIRLLDAPRTTFCVLSQAEKLVFLDQWSLRRANVVCTPFSHTLFDRDDEARSPAGDLVFAGGNSMRDYSALVEAARGLDAHIRIATSLELGDVPSNVEVGPMPHEEFVEALRTARVVVVPLRDDGYRSAGQQTYLNAMLSERPVVVTDCMGVREMVVDGRTGLVVDKTAVSMRAALDWCLRDAAPEELALVGAQARAAVLEQWTPHHYRERLLSAAGFAAA